jgi:hypothetical protein
VTNFVTSQDTMRLSIASTQLPGDALEHSFRPKIDCGISGIDFDTRSRSMAVYLSRQAVAPTFWSLKLIKTSLIFLSTSRRETGVQICLSKKAIPNIIFGPSAPIICTTIRCGKSSELILCFLLVDIEKPVRIRDTK